MEDDTGLSVVEALILASPEPIAARKIADVFDDLSPSKVAEAVTLLNNRYMESGSSYRIRELAGGYQFYIVPEFAGYVDELFTRRRKMRITRAALETLAIIAYRQPVTKTGVEHIRGVASDGVLHNLLEKKLITIKGRANGVGRPLLYGTTDEFLKFFGLNQLQDLPKMSEIEELIRASEPENQTTLQLGDSEADERPVKLNIADGTYDPIEQSDEDAIEPPAVVTQEATTAEAVPDDDDQDANGENDDTVESTETTDEHDEHRIIVDVDTT